uniref:Coiled-coil domain-containing protein 50 isoform X2 n=1 Tax=Geotrypetes seraphini TaxID=260995 RepID=A0A6P8S846_GEOSA|nr:coiled-coil domain-containing protein 50 isoform X2 [Geotrypetes seraphini]
MADTSIDQTKLPGVKEVCRDFAVLEDHTLAYNLQEQEIEHHLASNIQRTRLVQHDLLVAKKLQEEEDLKSRARIQKHYKDLEHQDSEIAQEIQEKLVIEAEKRLRQEEKDEDIARKLQDKEIKERKRQTKQHTERLGHELFEDGYYQETRDHSRDKHKEYEHDSSRRHRNRERHYKPPSESKHSQSRFYTDMSEQQSHVEENPQKPCREQEARRAHRHEEHYDRPNSWNDRSTRSPLPRSVRDIDVDLEHATRQPSTNSGKPKSQSQDILCSTACHDGNHHNPEVPKRREYRKDEPSAKRGPPRSPSPCNGRTQANCHDPGTGSRGVRDTTHGKMRADVKHLELQDAQMARQLQEEELMASRSDMRAVQVAQDEPDTVEHTPPRSRDGPEVHRLKNDKPARPPPPQTLSDYAEFKGSQHISTRPSARSESTYKGSTH